MPVPTPQTLNAKLLAQGARGGQGCLPSTIAVLCSHNMPKGPMKGYNKGFKVQGLGWVSSIYLLKDHRVSHITTSGLEYIILYRYMQLLGRFQRHQDALLGAENSHVTAWLWLLGPLPRAYA